MNPGADVLNLLTQIDGRLARLEARLGEPSPATYSVQEASELRNRSVRHIYNLIATGKIKPTGPRPYRLPATELAKIV